MKMETIIEAMTQQKILEADLSAGPTAIIVTKDERRPKCLVVRADGEDFSVDVPGFFASSKIKVSRADVIAQAEKMRKLKEFLESQE